MLELRRLSPAAQITWVTSPVRARARHARHSHNHFDHFQDSEQPPKMFSLQVLYAFASRIAVPIAVGASTVLLLREAEADGIDTKQRIGISALSASVGCVTMGLVDMAFFLPLHEECPLTRHLIQQLLVASALPTLTLVLIWVFISWARKHGAFKSTAGERYKIGVAAVPVIIAAGCLIAGIMYGVSLNG